MEKRKKGSAASNRRTLCSSRAPRGQRGVKSAEEEIQNMIKFIPSPHTLLNSFERDAKSKLWPIRHWGGEADDNP